MLELEQERHLVREGYDFLDEKRLLLAAETLKQLAQYEARHLVFTELHKRATVALAEACARHGVNGLVVYPAPALEDARLETETRSFLGVTLVEASLGPSPEADETAAPNPSPEARHCRMLFRELVRGTVALAVLSSNLHRLLAEYRHTERRARALEDVILPEIEAILKEISNRLEELDQEEAVRVHLNRRAAPDASSPARSCLRLCPLKGL